MSRAKNKKPQSATELSVENTVAWTGRLEVPLLDALKPHAKKGRRSIAAQINLVMEEWLQTHKLPTSPQITTHPQVMTPRQAQAVPPAIPTHAPVPQDALKELVEDDENWEGLPPSGKVKI